MTHGANHLLLFSSSTDDGHSGSGVSSAGCAGGGVPFGVLGFGLPDGVWPIHCQASDVASNQSFSDARFKIDTVSHADKQRRDVQAWLGMQRHLPGNPDEQRRHRPGSRPRSMTYDPTTKQYQRNCKLATKGTDLTNLTATVTHPDGSNSATTPPVQVVINR